MSSAIAVPEKLKLRLSPQERRVFEFILAGHSAKQIARSMMLSTYTVNGHLKSLYRKLNVGSRYDLLIAVIHEIVGARGAPAIVNSALN